MNSLSGLTVASALLLVSAASSAQTVGEIRSGDRFLGASIGASFYSPVGANLGQTPDRKLLLGALHSEWVLEDIYRIALMSTLDLIPIAVVTNNPTYREERNLDPHNSGQDKVQTGSAPVYGAGITPFGLKAALPAVKDARLFLAGAVGCLWFTRDMPVPDSRRFNFAFEYGGGIQFQRNRRQVILVGYKFHHLSNAYTAPRNPGLDGNVFYIGLLRGR